MSLINSDVKPFKATAFHNGKFVDVSDADLKNKWSVVFFYPADFTFVCPTELGDLADNYAEFQKLGVEIYSVSTDTHFTHKAWHDTSDTIKKIKYPLIGDPTGNLTRNFDVMIERRPRAARHFVVYRRAKSNRTSPAGGLAATPPTAARSNRPDRRPRHPPGDSGPAKWRTARNLRRRWIWSARSDRAICLSEHASLPRGRARRSDPPPRSATPGLLRQSHR